MSVSSYQRHEHKGIRTTTCPDCDGSGLEGDSGEGWWEQSDCQKCEGTGEFYACHECGENKAVCDDYCVDCETAFYLANPDEVDFTDKHWELPEWRTVRNRIENAKRDAK